MPLLSYGSDRGNGSLLGIQPYLSSDDYRSETAFLSALDSYFGLARERGWLGPKTVAVLPEFIGFYLLFAGENEAVYRASSLPEAGKRMALNHAGRLALRMARYRGQDGGGYRQIINLKAPLAAGIYQQVFTTLAKRHSLTVVAGSTLLPEPEVKGGKIAPNLSGPVRNAGFVFKPSGEVEPKIVRKSFPISDERETLGVQAGTVDELPIFETPAGRLGVLICADAWYPQAYEALSRKGGVDLLAIPSYSLPEGFRDRRALMRDTWHGYNLPTGVATPADVDPNDFGRITSREAWRKYALSGRFAVSGARYGLNVFMSGDLWGQGTDGVPPLVVRNGQSENPREMKGSGCLTCVWLE